MSDLFDPLPADAGTRRKENTRTRLVRASLEVFVEKGIDAATVDDLVRAAGFTRGAFYSSFASKEEVFSELFASVTDELMGIIATAVSDLLPAEEGVDAAGCAIGSAPSRLDDAAMLVTAFEAIRPFGRQWYLLYSEAVARSLRDDSVRSDLTAQRGRLNAQIRDLMVQGMERAGDRPLLPVDDLSQLVVGMFIDLLLREQLDGEDITELAATTILGTLNAFIEPGGDTPTR